MRAACVRGVPNAEAAGGVSTSADCVDDVVKGGLEVE